MSDIAIHHGWAPGVIGRVVQAHGTYYAREWRFGPAFEARVAHEMGQFLDRYDPVRDRLIWAEQGGRFLGSITIDGSDPALTAGLAHLRWFIVKDEARGAGLGRRLMAAALRFLTEGRAEACYLATFAGLEAARRLYERVGFILVEEAEAETWGTRVMEQRFILELGRPVAPA